LPSHWFYQLDNSCYLRASRKPLSKGHHALPEPVSTTTQTLRFGPQVLLLYGHRANWAKLNVTPKALPLKPLVNAFALIMTLQRRDTKTLQFTFDVEKV
jgi:hypothetical protein